MAVIDLKNTPLSVGFGKGSPVQSSRVEQNTGSGSASKGETTALGELCGCVENLASCRFRADREVVIALAYVRQVVNDLRIIQIQRVLQPVPRSPGASRSDALPRWGE